MSQKESLKRKHFRLESARIQSVYAKRGDQSRYQHREPAHLFLLQELERQIVSLLQANRLSVQDQRILEVGCGSGYWLRQFVQWGAKPTKLAGIDLNPSMIANARACCANGITLKVGDASILPFFDESFDLVVQFVMFSSITDAEVRQTIAQEILRVTTTKGTILWYDFFVNNPFNDRVHGIRRAELDRLFPECQMDVRKVTLAPPITRRLARYSWLGCYLLERLRICNTFYLAVIQK